MVLIPVLGAAFLKTLEVIQEPEMTGGVPIFSIGVGFVAAFITGLLACSWMIQIVKKGKLIYFAGYCVIIATIALYIYW